MAWKAGWNYRKSHVISQLANAIANTQVGIKVYYGAGVDGTETVEGVGMGKVYLNSKCKTDFGDIRFTASDGTTEWDYLCEYKVDSNYAVFWIEVRDNLALANVTFYIYYGNAGVSTTESGPNTFVDYDDFETNLAAWTVTGTCSCDAAYPFKGSKGLKAGYGTGQDFIYKTQTITNKAIRVRFRDIKSVSLEKTVLSCPGGGKNFLVGVDEDQNATNYIYRIDATYYNSGIARTTAFHLFEIRHKTVGGNLQSVMIDGNLMANTLVSASTTSRYIGSLWIGTTCATYYDLYFIRNYNGTEPTHSTWGSLEGLPEDPTNLAGVCVGTTEIDLTWTDNSTTESAYYVERDGVQLDGALPANTQAYSDTTVVCDASYVYRVRAYDAVSGLYSNYVTLAAMTCECPVIEVIGERSKRRFKTVKQPYRFTVNLSPLGVLIPESVTQKLPSLSTLQKGSISIKVESLGIVEEVKRQILLETLSALHLTGSKKKQQPFNDVLSWILGDDS